MDLRSLSIAQLMSLQALLASKSISVAAEKSFVTQPAMSVTLKKLREVFEDPLLVTTGKSSQLTHYAKQLIPKLDKFLDYINSLNIEKKPFDPTLKKEISPSEPLHFMSI